MEDNPIIQYIATIPDKLQWTDGVPKPWIDTVSQMLAEPASLTPPQTEKGR